MVGKCTSSRKSVEDRRREGYQEHRRCRHTQEHKPAFQGLYKNEQRGGGGGGTDGSGTFEGGFGTNSSQLEKGTS